MLHVLSIGFQSSVISLHISRTSTCLCKQEFSSNYYLLYLNAYMELVLNICRSYSVEGRRALHGLRSANSFKLYIPRTQSRAGRSTADRAFSISGPKQWNQLPDSIQNSCSLDVCVFEFFRYRHFKNIIIIIIKVSRTVPAKRTNMGGPPRKHLLGKCLLNNV